MGRSSSPVCRFLLAALMLLEIVGSALATAPNADGEPSKVLDSAILQGIAHKLEAENAECSVELTYTGRLNTRQIEAPSRFDSTLVVVYTVEGCGGGINWSASAQVYGLKGETARELGEVQTWSNVVGVEFSDSRVRIRALVQGPDDAHCCPTDGRTVEVTMLGDQPTFRQIETWRPDDKARR